MGSRPRINDLKGTYLEIIKHLMMTIIIEGKEFNNKEQAIIELAFCHYPVVVEIDGDKQEFSSFDAAREFVESK